MRLWRQLCFEFISRVYDLADCAGLDGAGKTTALSHLNAPYQHFRTTYTNPLLAPEPSAAQAAKAGAAADGESKTNSSDANSKNIEGKADAEAKTKDGESEEQKEALVPIPDLVPFDDIILPTCGVHLSEFEHQGQCVRVWDLSGQGKFRPLWEEYFQKVGSLLPKHALRFGQSCSAFFSCLTVVV